MVTDRESQGYRRSAIIKCQFSIRLEIAGLGRIQYSRYKASIMTAPGAPTSPWVF